MATDAEIAAWRAAEPARLAALAEARRLERQAKAEAEQAAKLPPSNYTVPSSFTTFASQVLGITQTPAQRVFSLVAFDGLQISELEPADRELAQQLFGDVSEIPTVARDIVTVLAGARGGKSWTTSLRLLHLALTVPFKLAKGEQAFALIVAPDMRLARQALRFAFGAADAVPALQQRIEDASKDGFTLLRGDGVRVRLECLPATVGGSAVRGRSLAGAVLDECCFFRGENAAVNDLEVYQAVAPRIVMGGQLIVASTPWAEAGLLWDLYSKNFGHPTTSLAAHAPTLLFRDNEEHVRRQVERERELNPDNAAREFDAQPMPAGSEHFFDPRAVDACVDADRPLVLSPDTKPAMVAAGADFGFRQDSSAIAVAFKRGELTELACLEEVKPERGKPLQPSVVISGFAGVAKRYGISVVRADSHYLETVREVLQGHGLTVVAAPEGQAGKAATYLYLRQLIHERRLRLPAYPRLIAQLKAIVSKPLPGGGLQITSPRRGAAGKGAGHGDLVSALVLATAGCRAEMQECEEEDSPLAGLRTAVVDGAEGWE